jgi:hypothetical protein
MTYTEQQMAQVIAAVMRAAGVSKVQVPIGQLIPGGPQPDELIYWDDPVTMDKVFRLRPVLPDLDGEEVPISPELTSP